MFVKFTKVGGVQQVGIRPDDIEWVEEKGVPSSPNSITKELAVVIRLKNGHIVHVKDKMDEVLDKLNEQRSPSREHMQYATTDVEMMSRAMMKDDFQDTRNLLKNTSDAIGESIRNSPGYQKMVKEMENQGGKQ